MKFITKTIALAVACALVTSSANAFSREDARWGYETDDAPVLDYIVCLEWEFGKTPRATNTQDALEIA